jgi:heme-degrading monooxygenase HmoA
MHARKATYTYTGDAHHIAQKAETGMLPILRSQPGFKAYSVFSTGDEIVSISVWESSDAAETANASIADWVADNLSDEITLQSAEICEIHFSTPLGISTKDRVTA